MRSATTIVIMVSVSEVITSTEDSHRAVEIREKSGRRQVLVDDTTGKSASESVAHSHYSCNVLMETSSLSSLWTKLSLLDHYLYLD